MSRESTLHKADQAIAAGNYAAARDSLQGLLATYPDDLSIRERLGTVYWRLGNPVMAGRYWYLAPVRDDDMAAARAAFEHSTGNRAKTILRVLKLKGDTQSLGDAHAIQIIEALQARVQSEQPQPSESDLARLREWQQKRALAFYSCLGIALLAALLFIAGFIFLAAKFL